MKNLTLEHLSTSLLVVSAIDEQNNVIEERYAESMEEALVIINNMEAEYPDAWVEALREDEL